MPKLPIKLGKTFGGEKPVALPGESNQEEYFPEVHLEWGQPYELPNEGTITFRYRVNRRSEDRKRDKFAEDLDLVAIVAVKPEKEDKNEDRGAELDKLKDEVMSEDDGEDY